VCPFRNIGLLLSGGSTPRCCGATRCFGFFDVGAGKTRDFILNMTPDQRKELGINKSTLWYIQKNLREGKKVKLYDKIRAKIV
jgi:hypothetical protein